MLVRFDSKAGTITMFADAAQQLLRMMGQSGAIPGAIMADDIAPALDRLRQGVSGFVEPAAQSRKDGNDRDAEPRISMRQRAFPLIELLERAAQHKADVIWEQETRAAI